MECDPYQPILLIEAKDVQERMNSRTVYSWRIVWIEYVAGKPCNFHVLKLSVKA